MTSADSKPGRGNFTLISREIFGTAPARHPQLRRNPLLQKRFYSPSLGGEHNYLFSNEFLSWLYYRQQEIPFSATPLSSVSHRLHTVLSTGFVDNWLSR
jgi:hypothetical protein